MLAVAMFMPTIVVLSVERMLDSSAVAALIGAVVGYLLRAEATKQPPQSKLETSNGLARLRPRALSVGSS
jgi:hypothetical protein